MGLNFSNKLINSYQNLKNSMTIVTVIIICALLIIMFFERLLLMQRFAIIVVFTLLHKPISIGYNPLNFVCTSSDL